MSAIGRGGNGKSGPGLVAGIREVTVYPAGVVVGGRIVTTGAVAVTATGAVVVTTAADLDKGIGNGDGKKRNTGSR